ncbi:MAG: GNAT family N-acetyltransferase [Candidatus Omnitrophota bacterium]
MKINYIIRDAQERDVPELCALHRLILELEGISHLITDEQLKEWYSVNSLPNHFILLKDNKIVSHMEVKERHFLYDGIPLKCGELSAVHTHPDYRGKNFGFHLMHHCFGFMKKNDMAFSMVLSGVKYFYHSGCYELYPLNTYPVTLATLLEHTKRAKQRNSTYLILPYSGERDGGRMYAIYCKRNVLVPTAGNFSEAYWNNLQSDEKKDSICLAVRKGPDTVGYLEAKPSSYYANDLLSVNILVDEGEEKAAIGLLSAFLEKCRNRHYSRAAILVNNGTARNLEMERSLLLKPTLESTRMFRIINLKKMVEKLLPLWAARFKQSRIDFEGTIEIECLGMQVRVEIRKGEFSLNGKTYGLRETYLNRLFEKQDCVSIYLPLTQRTLFSLLCEQISPRDLLNDGTLNLDTDRLALLEAILCRKNG